ncbi:50S ribosomal protein L20 [candidate division KSB1 bacterium]|nr:50S ribosomal protein L20 [candidate division KSB1 bacterium]
MPRAKNAVASRKRRKKTLKSAKGYRGGKSKLLKTAMESVERSMLYAYRDRRKKKHDFRQLWITRINAAVRPHGLNYSQFISMIAKNNILLNRKVLADLAATDAVAFGKIVESIQKA